MPKSASSFLTVLVLAALASPVLAKAPCGGGFKPWLDGVKQQAVAQGHSSASVGKFLHGVRINNKVLAADRAQGVFKLTFLDFAGRAVSSSRMSLGKKHRVTYDSSFQRAQKTYGVDPSVLLAFWALETDYGVVQGNFNTLNALVTLSYDCRRPDLFRPQIFAALELYERGDFNPAKTTGAWAGEIGMVQMLPEDILHRGVDGDGDGHVRLKTSPPDALMTGARLLRDLGWRANEPWLVEVSVPKTLDWSLSGLDKSRPVSKWAALGVKPRAGKLSQSGLQASLLLPQGRKGPAFLALPNFHVYFEWNKSMVYVTTAAYFATRLGGAPRVTAGNPDPALTDAQMKSLQKKLVARGHDVGKIDGILGAKTRAAVQREQQRLGFPADAWPTRAFVAQL